MNGVAAHTWSSGGRLLAEGLVDLVAESRGSRAISISCTYRVCIRRAHRSSGGHRRSVVCGWDTTVSVAGAVGVAVAVSVGLLVC